MAYFGYGYTFPKYDLDSAVEGEITYDIQSVCNFNIDILGEIIFIGKILNVNYNIYQVEQSIVNIHYSAYDEQAEHILDFVNSIINTDPLYANLFLKYNIEADIIENSIVDLNVNIGLVDETIIAIVRKNKDD